ncbi:hypothetical protein BH11PLA2_BH11PLA2_36640 [soil metagenome]
MLRWFLALTVAAVSLSTATAAFTISTVPSIGPIQSGPGASAYYANAAAGLQAGGSSGVVNTPSWYAPSGSSVQGGAINNIDALGPLTGLWNGDTSAAGAFAGSLGNAIYMGLSLKGDSGSTASASQVSYSGTSFAFGNSTGIPDLSTVLGGGNVYGALTPGGALSVVSSGATQYAELYYVGQAYSIVNNFGVDWTTAANLAPLFTPPLTPQGFLSGSWSVNNGIDPIATGVGSTEINGAPAPATLVLMGLGFVGSSVVARVRRRRNA